MTRISDQFHGTARPSLPAWLDRYTTLGLYGLLVGTGLCLVAFLTSEEASYITAANIPVDGGWTAH